MSGKEFLPPSTKPVENESFLHAVNNLSRTYADFVEMMDSEQSVSKPEDGQLLSPQSLLAQAANFVMIDAHDMQAGASDVKSQAAIQAAIRFHLLDSLAVGSTPESYELYDLVDNPDGLIAEIEDILAQEGVTVGVTFHTVSDYARHIAYDEEYNDRMFSKITFAKRRELLMAAAVSLSRPYFDKVQNVITGAE